MQILKEIGAHDEPSTGDLLQLLQHASSTLAHRELNMNERNAILRLFECIELATLPGSQEEKQVGEHLP